MMAGSELIGKLLELEKYLGRTKEESDVYKDIPIDEEVHLILESVIKSWKDGDEEALNEALRALEITGQYFQEISIEHRKEILEKYKKKKFKFSA